MIANSEEPVGEPAINGPSTERKEARQNHTQEQEDKEVQNDEDEADIGRTESGGEDSGPEQMQDTEKKTTGGNKKRCVEQPGLMKTWQMTDETKKQVGKLWK